MGDSEAWARQPTLLTAVAGICLLAAPGGLPLIAWDLGRFDVIGLLLMMVALAVVPRWRPAASLVLIAVLGGVGVAVHEAVLVAQLPLMLTAWWATARPAPREGAMLVTSPSFPRLQS
jgi:cell division protein FtsW (lipid II flippase)